MHHKLLAQRLISRVDKRVDPIYLFTLKWSFVIGKSFFLEEPNAGKRVFIFRTFFLIYIIVIRGKII